MHQRRGDHIAAVVDLDAALRFEIDILGTMYGPDARSLAVALGEIGRLREAEQLMLQVIDVGLQDVNETESLYTLAALASLLVMRGDDELAAAARCSARAVAALLVTFRRSPAMRARALALLAAAARRGAIPMAPRHISQYILLRISKRPQVISIVRI